MTSVSIGIDVGGTHTDLIAVRGKEIVRAKSLTTHDDYSEGIFTAINSAAEDLRLSLKELLSEKARVFVNGNTIVTNAVTELKGAKVGVLVTAGFRDIPRFGRGNRSNEIDDQRQINLPQIVANENIIEIDERVDRDGNIVIPLNRTQVHEAVRKLMEAEVDAIAICFLWCSRNEKNERQVESIVRELAPNLFVTCSVSAAPVFREYERWMTAILNCYVQPPVDNFVTRIVAGLRKHGYQKAVEFFNGLGGVLGEEEVRQQPVLLYSSGPAGGAIGASALARRYGISNLLCGDMGGTSFDTTLIHNERPLVAQRCQVGPFATSVSLLDIISIGAGGGSLVGLDARGVPKVGPESVGSMPGPACYGNGGEFPAMTDCMVTMGFLRPDNYLGGKHRLDVEAARESLTSHVGNKMGWSPEQVSAGAYNLAVANMANALRSVSIRRGYDPRKCTFVAYGGALPMFAAAICKQLNIEDMIVPNHSSAFSAYGLLEADYVRRKSVTVGWVVEDRAGLSGMLARRKILADSILEEMVGAGFAKESVRLLHGADFRYMGQLSEMYLDLDETDILQDGKGGLREKFDSEYEKEFGPETAWKNSSLMLVNYVITGVAIREKPEIEPADFEENSATSSIKETRRVYLPDLQAFHETSVYDSELIEPGGAFTGPGIIEVRDTTIYIPSESSVFRDGYFNYRVRL